MHPDYKIYRLSGEAAQNDWVKDLELDCESLHERRGKGRSLEGLGPPWLDEETLLFSVVGSGIRKVTLLLLQ